VNLWKVKGDRISRLKEDTLENIRTGTNCFSGNISLGQLKLLCLPIPYSAGWVYFSELKRKKIK